jgi:hypothetical protein
VVVEGEQELLDHEEDVEEEGELISLVQQPEAVEEAAGEVRLVGSRGVGESAQGVDRVHHSFCFSPPKRDRKLSDEEQQEEAKRPKSPERKDEQQAEERSGLIRAAGLRGLRTAGWIEEISPQVLLLGGVLSPEDVEPCQVRDN